MKTPSTSLSVIFVCLLITLSLSCKKDVPKDIPKVAPILSTNAAYNITSNSITCGGTISSDGNAPIISRGVCWNTSRNPTTSDSKITDDSSTGINAFEINVTGLSPARKYFLRAYATNSVGTAYGNEVSFITLPLPLTIVGGGQSTNFNFTQFTPKLITPESEDIIILEVNDKDFTSSPVLQTIWGENIAMVDDGTNSDKIANDNVYTCRLSKELILQQNGSTELNKPVIGRMYTKDGFTSFFAQVWNSNIPEVSPIKLSDNIQRTDRVVNIATASTITVGNHDKYTKQFYSFFNDNYDYISIVYPGINENRHYISTANSILGIGLPVRNASSLFGSASRLRGILVFPNTEYYDGASVGYQHELGHCWINFLTVPSLRIGVPHWPISDLASSIMGHSIGGGQGLDFNYNIVKQSENSWVLQDRTEPSVFNDFDLYLMGLMPPTEVKPYIVFENSNQDVRQGATLTGPVTTVTVDDIIKEHGERVPNYQNSPKIFKIATIIISYYPLSQKEMSFYEYYTQRAELTNLVQVKEGYTNYLSSPFYLSTGKRGTIDTKL